MIPTFTDIAFTHATLLGWCSTASLADFSKWFDTDNDSWCQSMSLSLQSSLVLCLRSLQQKLVSESPSRCPSTPACACQQLMSSASYNGHDYFDSDNALSTSAKHDFMNEVSCLPWFLTYPWTDLNHRVQKSESPLSHLSSSCLILSLKNVLLISQGVLYHSPYAYSAGIRQWSQSLWTFFHLYRYNNIVIFEILLNGWSTYSLLLFCQKTRR